LVGAKAEQGRDIADFVKLGLVFYVEQFDIADDCIANNWVADIFDFARRMSARGTVTD
jgi:hypothetical protein